MSYVYDGMRRIPWSEVKEILRRDGNLGGYYYLYGDNTESQIDASESIVNIIEHYERGGEFGEETKRKVRKLSLPDGKIIYAPLEIDLTPLDSLDELEYEIWHLIQSYMEYFGIKTEDDEPDWATVKEVQETLLKILKDAGVNFKFIGVSQ